MTAVSREGGRVFLVFVAWCFGIVAWQTLEYPPDYLLARHIWAGLAILAAVMCAATAVSPRQTTVSLGGAAIVASALGRASAITIQIARGDIAAAPFANFAVAATVWALVGAMGFVVWRHYVLPWAALRRRTP